MRDNSAFCRFFGCRMARMALSWRRQPLVYTKHSCESQHKPKQSFRTNWRFGVHTGEAIGGKYCCPKDYASTASPAAVWWKWSVQILVSQARHSRGYNGIEGRPWSNSSFTHNLCRSRFISYAKALTNALYKTHYFTFFICDFRVGCVVVLECPAIQVWYLPQRPPNPNR